GHKHEAIDPESATCTEAGHTSGIKCGVCGEILVATTVVPAKGHTEQEIAEVPATCTEAGHTAGVVCSVCGEVIKATEVVEAKGHQFGEWVTIIEATLEHDGVQKRICEHDPLHVETREITFGGHSHDWSAWAVSKPATCMTDGEETRECSDCHEIQTRTIAMSADYHKYVTDAAVSATCTESGLSEGAHCELCGHVVVAQTEIPALGHDYDEGVVTKNPEIGVEGEKLFTCHHDPSHTYTEKIPALVAPDYVYEEDCDIIEEEREVSEAAIIETKFESVVYVNNANYEYTSYQWYHNGAKIEGATEQYYKEEPQLTGMYSVIVTKKDGQQIKVCATPASTVSISKKAAYDLTVYPNPARAYETVTIKLRNVSESELDGAKMMIFNNAGSLVKTINEVAEYNDVNLPAGQYSGTVIIGQSKLNFKLIVR
ncbi:MAG: T9SS type A sorting domain-containing protein, partial [Bacteroidales bacterium]|nr:T9SS type A sorting domain-containing protein [Bacteroidales bacterium]